MVAVVRLPQLQNYGDANLNYAVCRGLEVILKNEPVLHKPQFTAQLNLEYTSRIAVFECSYTAVLSADFSVYFQSSYVPYCINDSSGLQLYSFTIYRICPTFVFKLCTVLHKSQFRSVVKILRDRRFMKFKCN